MPSYWCFTVYANGPTLVLCFSKQHQKLTQCWVDANQRLRRWPGINPTLRGRPPIIGFSLAFTAALIDLPVITSHAQHRAGPGDDHPLLGSVRVFSIRRTYIWAPDWCRSGPGLMTPEVKPVEEDQLAVCCAASSPYCIFIAT